MHPWSFAFATDIHVGSPRSFRFAPAFNENWQTARRQIVACEPDLLLVGGDVTRDGSLPEHAYELDLIKADLDALPFPYFVTPGNMDTGNKHTDVQGPFRDRRDDLALNLTSDELDRFCAVFGPHCWTVVHNNVRFSGFCTMVAGSGLPEEKALWDWLEAQAGAPRMPYHVWLTHHPLFMNTLDEPDFDITDPEQYRGYYFGMNRRERNRLMDVFRATGATHVLSGHVHCRKSFVVEDIQFDIGPSTAFPQDADRWPDGDDTLGFLRYDVTDAGIASTFVPLEKVSGKKGYGPGGHPLPEHRNYSIAWKKDHDG